MGATAISASVAAQSIEAGLLHAVDLPLPERQFCVPQHKTVIAIAPAMPSWPCPRRTESTHRSLALRLNGVGFEIGRYGAGH